VSAAYLLCIVVATTFLFQTAAFAQIEYAPFDNHGFYIEYPSSWKVADTWHQQDGEVSFRPGSSDGTQASITVSYGDAGVDISQLDQDFLDFLENQMYEECRSNKNGPCWSFVMLDSKLIIIEDRTAVSIKYSATINDEKIVVRNIMLPDGPQSWMVEWRTLEGFVRLEEQLERSIDSFLLYDEDASGDIPVARDGPAVQPAVVHEGIMVQRTYDVNIILVGQEWNGRMKSGILEELVDYREPIYYSTMESMGVRHNYNYNFVSVTGEDVDRMAEFMLDNSMSSPIFGWEWAYMPIWQVAWLDDYHPEWVAYDYNGNIDGFNIDYRQVDALAIEEYIYERLIGNNPELSESDSVNLVFLALGLDDANYLRNYYISSRDDATGERFTAHGLRGFGGSHNMMFFDLHAAPWVYDDWLYDYFYGDGVLSYESDLTQFTLHDCYSPACMGELVVFHTDQALQYVVSPHLLYPVVDADRYVVEALIYVLPYDRATVTKGILPKLIDIEKIQDELAYLYPHSKWEINFSVEREDTRGVSFDFKQVLAGTDRKKPLSSIGSEKTIHLLYTDDIIPYLTDWADGQDREYADGQTHIIPLLIAVGTNTEADLYMNRFGVLGIAPPQPNSTEACCAFAVTSQKKLWNENVGFTDLLIHEVGHAVGLMHPFMSIDQYGGTTGNEYFQWYASPMTYSSPNSGCGLLFYLIYPEPCGNASLSFTEFERNVITDARLVSLWEKADANLRQGDFQNTDASALLSDSKRAHDDGDLYSLRGSLALAKEAYKLSLSDADGGDRHDEETTVQPPQPPQPPSTVPSWVKNNAKWWSDGLLDDTTFMQGIQYLLENGVIVIHDLPECTAPSSAEKIPSWVKNTAGWWSDGLLSQDDFVGGIKYMIEQGLICIQ